ncbi:MAG TPA: PD-(D/E)XK nuclease family protein, partial [Burkholderiaceae bacterium]|nr:PD-(D/E)XK nuclease family protein [Burkholderiaceae bacterium]
VPPARLKVLRLLARPEAPARARAVPRSPDTDATRLGKAVHRALEWAAASRADALTDLAHAAAAEFDAPATTVAQLAQTILQSPDCARFFSGPQLRWAGNEVPIAEGGEVLRIDRLVQLVDAAGPAWWVLDYKLQHAPHQLDAYRAQLRRYREAVRRVQPGEAVRCAFLTGAGEVIEID